VSDRNLPALSEHCDVIASDLWRTQCSQGQVLVPKADPHLVRSSLGGLIAEYLVVVHQPPPVANTGWQREARPCLDARDVLNANQPALSTSGRKAGVERRNPG